MQTPLRYREVGVETWLDGRLENISRSGVFFRTDSALGLKTSVQMSFSLPVSITGDDPGEVYCWGSVVRTVPARDGKLSGIAVAMRSYRLVRRHH